MPFASTSLNGSPAETGGAALAGDGLRVLLNACIRNERVAQKKLYDTYSPTIYGVILRYTADVNISAELLNEAFYRILTRLEQYRYEGAFEGWMRRIAVHTITDYYRREKKHSQVGTLPEADGPVSDGLTAGAQALGAMGYKELLALVQALPDLQRAVFNLFVFEDLPHKEIGRMLDISEANSRWHLNDARRRLKDKIAIMNA